MIFLKIVITIMFVNKLARELFWMLGEELQSETRDNTASFRIASGIMAILWGVAIWLLWRGPDF
jgi:hypothetical protein